MDLKSINKLNQLNTDFYNTTAKDFDESRQYYWEGWEKIPPLLDEFQSFRCLDLGCGNGRFGQFLQERCPQIKLSYTGVDANAELLDVAEKNLLGKIPALHIQQNDIVNSLVNNVDFLENQQFHLIVAFGVFHHIPTYELRKKLLEYMLSKISSDGFIVISFWQFMEFDRLRKKVVKDNQTLTTIIGDTQLETNDFIMDWKRGQNAFRFCHLVDEQEQTKLISQTNAQLIKKYRADAKEGNANQYVILKKNN